MSALPGQSSHWFEVKATMRILDGATGGTFASKNVFPTFKEAMLCFERYGNFVRTQQRFGKRVEPSQEETVCFDGHSCVWEVEGLYSISQVTIQLRDRVIYKSESTTLLMDGTLIVPGVPING